MDERDLKLIRDILFIIAMAWHTLVLRIFIHEYTEYNLGFSVALSLPVVYTIQRYTRTMYLMRGKYYVLRKPFKERVVNEIVLFITSTVVAYALYVGFGGRSFTWFLIGFSVAWVMRMTVTGAVNMLYSAGMPVDQPLLMLIVGLAIGALYGVLMGIILSFLGLVG